MVHAEAAVTAFPWERSYPRNVDWHAAIEGGVLTGILDETVRRFGDRPCVDFLGLKLTYTQVSGLVDRTAKGLQALGVGPGVHVGLMLPNCPYFIVAFFGVLKAGGTVVNFNPLYAEREIAQQIDDSCTDIMITLDLRPLVDKLNLMLDRSRLRTIVVCRMTGILPVAKKLLLPLVRGREIARVVADDRHVLFERLTDNDGRPTPVSRVPSDLAVLQYTGGTTGLPKGAMLSHANLHANVEQCSHWFAGAVPGEERMLAVLPFFHVFAMTVIMNLGIRYGAEIIMLPRFEATAVLKLIDRKKPTLFPAVPTVYSALVGHPRLRRYDLSSLRICLSGGAPLPVEVKQRFEQLTGCRLVEGYGLTETAPVATANPLAGVNKAGSIGLPLPGTVIDIVSLEEPRRAVSAGERGEVCIRGPQVMAGYWNQPEETAACLVNGRLHTGDIGYMDEDGYTYLVDRIKDLILCGAYNVYPRVIEEAIYLHPSVAECIVIGVTDEYRGQTVKAFIKLHEGRDLSHRELIDFLQDKLSPIEMPKQVEFRDELPKTMIGKLSRRAMIEEEEAKCRAQGR